MNERVPGRQRGGACDSSRLHLADVEHLDLPDRLQAPGRVDPESSLDQIRVLQICDLTLPGVEIDYERSVARQKCAGRVRQVGLAGERDIDFGRGRRRLWRV